MEITCPYCRAPFSNTENLEDAPVPCSACGTPHHADCLAENGGCTVFGCAQAPEDETKVSVSTQDVVRPQAAAPPPPLEVMRVAPPPRPAGAPSPLAISANDFAPAFSNVTIAPSSFTFGGYAPPTPHPLHQLSLRRRNRVAYVMLAVFFGTLGVHNFYAGYIKRAVIQLCVTVLTFFIASPFIWVWAIVEACTVREDDDNVAFS